MSNGFGEIFRITTFGESHGPAVGVVIDGVRPGLPLDGAAVQAELDLRRPGRGGHLSPRSEPDLAEILSGVFEGVTTGAPVCILVRNRDARPGDYQSLRDVFRPGHADFAWLAKYGVRDWRGGGRASGRETVGRVAAGAVARGLLRERGVAVSGHVIEVAGVRARAPDREAARKDPMRCGDPAASKAMLARVLEAKRAGDSVGGVVEVVAEGVPAGWGDPVFRKLDAMLAQAMISIGAVKGVEVGDGFAAARMRGSRHNDPIAPGGFLSNHAGGILGGVSNGAPVVVRLAVKPTSSISRPQRTIDVSGRERTIEVRGRHDPCLCPRIVPVAEAMMALVLADACLSQEGLRDAAADLPGLAAAVAGADRDLLIALARRVALGREAGGLSGSGRGAGRMDAAGLRRAWKEAAADLGLDGSLAAKVLDLLR